MGFTGFDQRRLLTLAGTLVLAGAVVAAGIYGPSAWKVLRHQGAPPDQVVIQNPPVDGNPINSVNQGANNLGTSTGTKTTGQAAPTATTTQIQGLNTPPQGDTSGPKKYKEPDTKSLDMAPSIANFFAGDALGETAKTLAYSTAWNIHQYVDGYLYGPTAGPQMNEQDIKKYIVFHKLLWDKQIKNEPAATKAAAFSDYLDVLLNRGTDAFDAKDKARIEQFHQEIHDLDSHLFRNDAGAKIYGATPFATKR